ncbi:hypothetical protein HZS55_02850 [Halosimplex rubrum]|uniref:Uncharacterized protein n=1 Tax=Halosimplex rubrum TaxID=869889 RepID=A0A7D5P299_9EURY|nr:hypothetical protein [Halosimplex rubrum]QLH76304.1 hypothetical protein HZS55_02850 [Halosimplex rubrum]
MLLVVTYSRAARGTLRNICRTHEEVVVRRFGRVALLAETEFAAFQALRLREKHGGDVQVERTRPFNEYEAVDESIREAATAYEGRDRPALPYATFADGSAHPDPDRMRDVEL